jgi:sortase A
VSRQRLVSLSAAAIAALGLLLMGQGLWIQAKAIAAQVLLEQAFEDSGRLGRPVKPWSWADTWPVARISVPRLRVSAIALEGGSGQSLAFGPAHLSQSAEPGMAGTAVYAAHRDTHFSFIGELRAGDEIRVTRADGITFSYWVTGSEIVNWDRPNIDVGAAGHNLALATCWPLDGTRPGPKRLVVHASTNTLPFTRSLLSVTPHG